MAKLSVTINGISMAEAMTQEQTEQFAESIHARMKAIAREEGDPPWLKEQTATVYTVTFFWRPPRAHRGPRKPYTRRTYVRAVPLHRRRSPKGN